MPATLSLASSTACRAARATECEPEGLPNRPDSQGRMASNASGQRGVVAAWSRYAGMSCKLVGASAGTDAAEGLPSRAEAPPDPV